MLAGNRMTTILPVSDPERARAFYGGALGLREAGLAGDGKILFDAGGAILALLPKLEVTPAAHTAISFEVDGIEAMLAALEARGIRFDDYDLPGLKTVDHVCVLGSEKAAWFRDPDGNILCLHEPVGKAPEGQK